MLINPFLAEVLKIGKTAAPLLFSILSVFIRNRYILVNLKKCSLLFTLTQFMFTLFTFHEKKGVATLNMLFYSADYLIASRNSRE